MNLPREFRPAVCIWYTLFLSIYIAICTYLYLSVRSLSLPFLIFTLSKQKFCVPFVFLSQTTEVLFADLPWKNHLRCSVSMKWEATQRVISTEAVSLKTVSVQLCSDAPTSADQSKTSALLFSTTGAHDLFVFSLLCSSSSLSWFFFFLNSVLLLAFPK